MVTVINKNIMRKVFLVALLFLLYVQGYAQSAVTGVVRDEAGKALVGVSIAQKNATNATMTEDSGTFKLELDPNKERILLFSMIGFEELELPVTEGQLMQVILKGQTKD